MFKVIATASAVLLGPDCGCPVNPGTDPALNLQTVDSSRIFHVLWYLWSLSLVPRKDAFFIWMLQNDLKIKKTSFFSIYSYFSIIHFFTFHSFICTTLVYKSLLEESLLQPDDEMNKMARMNDSWLRNNYVLLIHINCRSFQRTG